MVVSSEEDLTKELEGRVVLHRQEAVREEEEEEGGGTHCWRLGEARTDWLLTPCGPLSDFSLVVHIMAANMHILLKSVYVLRWKSAAGSPTNNKVVKGAAATYKSFPIYTLIFQHAIYL